ncbi:hypothetical protein L7F22_034220 [Adiantum nelumboides]|nr:hypothetical protein [Adiantum nelumboides]
MQVFVDSLRDRWLTVWAAAAAVAVVIGLLCECGLAVHVPEEKPVPAIFAFGDSLLDAGNNNGKANHPPYGQDFPTRTATGRFVNGYMILDLIALKLGLPLTPTHSDPSTKGLKLLHGVNFGSAGSGIQSYTGHELGKVYSLDVQIQHFAQVKQEIIATIGFNATSFLIKKALFYIVTGVNDWLLYTGQMSLYKAVNGTCVQSLNEVAKDFNDQWKPQFLALSSTLPGTHFTFQDAYTALLTVRNNPSDYGYTIVDRACCGIGNFQGLPYCFKACQNVKDHLFWDAYHPTSRFQEQFLDLVWNNGPPYSYPYSGKQFLSLLRD